MHYHVRAPTPTCTTLAGPGSRSKVPKSVAEAPAAPASPVASRRGGAKKLLTSACTQSPSSRLPTPPHQSEISQLQRGVCVTQAAALKAYKGYLHGLDALIASAPQGQRVAMTTEFMSREQRSFNAFLNNSLGELTMHSRGLGGDALAGFGREFGAHFGPSEDARAPFGSRQLGEGLFAQLMKAHPLSAGAAQQAGSRRRLIVDELRNILPPSGHTRLLSVGCGSCDELADMFDSAKAFESLEMVMVDEHLPTLQQASCTMTKLADAAGQTSRASFVRKSIASLARAESLARMGTFDVIYSMGLFEYLPHDDARQLADGMRRALKPGGALVIGQYWSERPTTALEQEWTDWNLVHRNDEDFLRLAGEDMQGEITTIANASGRQRFLKAFKSA